MRIRIWVFSVTVLIAAGLLWSGAPVQTDGVLTGPGADIIITSMTCTGPGGTSGSGGCFFSGTAGADVVAVGGTISIPASQTAGAYTGVFDITGTHDPAC